MHQLEKAINNSPYRWNHLRVGVVDSGGKVSKETLDGRFELAKRFQVEGRQVAVTGDGVLVGPRNTILGTA